MAGLNDSNSSPFPEMVHRGQSVRGPGADSKLLVIALRCGRLANRLVLFANFIALAQEQGHRLINFTFHSYAHLFESTRRDIYCRYPPAVRRSLWDVIPGLASAIRKSRIFYHAVRGAGTLNERLPLLGAKVVTLREPRGRQVYWLNGPEVQNRMRGARIVFVYGWKFRAPACVERHAEKIRAYFRPVTALEDRSRAAVERLRKEADMVVGVHVRHGDYRTWKGGKCFFTAAQYAAWMHGLAEEFPGRKVAFLVCSDEPRRSGEFPGLTVGLGAGSPVADLYALAGCDLILGPVSTFTQWASFYGNKPLFHLHSAADRPEREAFAVSWLKEIP